MKRKKVYYCGHCGKQYSDHHGKLATDSKGRHANVANPFGCSDKCAIEIYNAAFRADMMQRFDRA